MDVVAVGVVDLLYLAVVSITFSLFFFMLFLWNLDSRCEATFFLIIFLKEAFSEKI